MKSQFGRNSLLPLKVQQQIKPAEKNGDGGAGKLKIRVPVHEHG